MDMEKEIRLAQTANTCVFLPSKAYSLISGEVITHTG